LQQKTITKTEGQYSYNSDTYLDQPLSAGGYSTFGLDPIRTFRDNRSQFYRADAVIITQKKLNQKKLIKYYITNVTTII